MVRAPDREPPGAVPSGGAALRGAIEAVAFVCELAMLVVLAAAGWGLGKGGLTSIALAVFYPALALLSWSIWMAPKSSRRLSDPWRLVGQLALFAATAVLASVANHPLLGISLGLVAAVTFVATRVVGGVTGS